jgi:hypothetical protein
MKSCTLWSWLIVLMTAITVSCKQEVKKGKYEFYYYPKVNMYYDVADQQYLYSLDSARTWTIIPDTTSQDTATLGNKEILYSDAKDIWKQNELHRQQFNGTILHIVSTDNEMAGVQNEVRERKVAVKKPAVQKPAEEKKKTKVGRFLQKIFGKKKDNQTQDQ